MPKLKVMLVGAGTMGKVHAAAYARLTDVELCAVVDPDAEAGEALARQYGARAYREFSSALNEVPCDFVDLCIPTYLHKPYTVETARRGKHVICEKPIALNVKDAEEMIRTCESNHVHLLIGHVVHFFPNYIRAKELIDAGRIGQVAVARTFRGGSHPHGWQNWYAKPELSGGVMMDLMIHDFDFLRWVFGPVERVYAKYAFVPDPVLAYAVCTLRFANGVIAHMEGSWAHEGFHTRFEFAGEKGIIEEDTRQTSTLTVAERHADTAHPGVAVPLTPVFQNPYEAEIAHFVDVIQRGQTPRVTAQDALEALRIALACQESARSGRVVKLSS